MTTLTARHKKPGGFRKLVNSLETTPQDKQVKILELMRKEDPDFVAEVEKCIFVFDDFKSLSDLILCEIITGLKTEMRTFALALYHSDPELIKKFETNMPQNQLRDFRQANEALLQVSQREQIAARFRIIEKSRELEKQKRFTMKKYSEHFREEP